MAQTWMTSRTDLQSVTFASCPWQRVGLEFRRYPSRMWSLCARRSMFSGSSRALGRPSGVLTTWRSRAWGSKAITNEFVRSARLMLQPGAYRSTSRFQWPSDSPCSQTSSIAVTFWAPRSSSGGCRRLSFRMQRRQEIWRARLSGGDWAWRSRHHSVGSQGSIQHWWFVRSSLSTWRPRQSVKPAWRRIFARLGRSVRHHAKRLLRRRATPAVARQTLEVEGASWAGPGPWC